MVLILKYIAQPEHFWPIICWDLPDLALTSLNTYIYENFYKKSRDVNR
mgnify:CR=1 FL=1